MKDTWLAILVAFAIAVGVIVVMERISGSSKSCCSPDAQAAVAGPAVKEARAPACDCSCTCCKACKQKGERQRPGPRKLEPATLCGCDVCKCCKGCPGKAQKE